MHSEGTTLLPPIDYRIVLSRHQADSSTSPGNLASRMTHQKAGFRLLGTSGVDFDGPRENYCIFEWHAPVTALRPTDIASPTPAVTKVRK